MFHHWSGWSAPPATCSRILKLGRWVKNSSSKDRKNATRRQRYSLLNTIRTYWTNGLQIAANSFPIKTKYLQGYKLSYAFLTPHREPATSSYWQWRWYSTKCIHTENLQVNTGFSNSGSWQHVRVNVHQKKSHGCANDSRPMKRSLLPEDYGTSNAIQNELFLQTIPFHIFYRYLQDLVATTVSVLVATASTVNFKIAVSSQNLARSEPDFSKHAPELSK